MLAPSPLPNCFKSLIFQQRQALYSPQNRTSSQRHPSEWCHGSSLGRVLYSPRPLKASSLMPVLSSASRGLGLEIVRQLVSVPDNVVFAACRSPEKASALKSLTPMGKLHLVALDLASEDVIAKAADEVDTLLAGSGLDYLFNNAGVVSSCVVFFDAHDTRSIICSGPMQEIVPAPLQAVHPRLSCAPCMRPTSSAQRSSLNNSSHLWRRAHAVS